MESTSSIVTAIPPVPAIPLVPTMEPLVSSTILNLLDRRTAEWAGGLTAQDFATILQSVHSIPGVMHALRASYSTQPTQLESQSAAEIGKQGEANFARICRALPENYQVINTAKQGKAGDFIIHYSAGRVKKSCLVDIKKYTTTVPKKELDKFYEDLTYGSYDAGLIISYSTKFVGISDNIYLEQKDLSYGSIPVMYLANVSEDLILQAIKILMLRVTAQAKHDADLDKLGGILSCINSALSQSAITRRILTELGTTVNTSIQRCIEQLITLEVQVKRSIAEISCIMDKSKCVEEAPFVMPPPAPPVTPREDNLTTDVIKLPPQPDLPPQESKNPNISAYLEAQKQLRTAIKTSRPLVACDFGQFCAKDIPLMKQLSIMDWQAFDEDEFTFENDAITLQIFPMKSQTRVLLTEVINVPQIKEFKSLFKRQKDELRAILSQKLVDAIGATFALVVDDGGDIPMLDLDEPKMPKLEPIVPTMSVIPGGSVVPVAPVVSPVSSAQVIQAVVEGQPDKPSPQVLDELHDTPPIQ